MSNKKRFSGKKTEKLTPERMAYLQADARRAWTGTPLTRDDPDTIESLVQCLTNVAVNRLARIRELETHLKRLLGMPGCHLPIRNMQYDPTHKTPLE